MDAVSLAALGAVAGGCQLGVVSTISTMAAQLSAIVGILPNLVEGNKDILRRLDSAEVRPAEMGAKVNNLADRVAALEKGHHVRHQRRPLQTAKVKYGVLLGLAEGRFRLFLHHPVFRTPCTCPPR